MERQITVASDTMIAGIMLTSFPTIADYTTVDGCRMVEGYTTIT